MHLKEKRAITAHAHVNKLVDDQLAKNSLARSSSVDKDVEDLISRSYVHIHQLDMREKKSVTHVLHHL